MVKIPVFVAIAEKKNVSFLQYHAALIQVAFTCTKDMQETRIACNPTQLYLIDNSLSL